MPNIMTPELLSLYPMKMIGTHTFMIELDSARLTSSGRSVNNWGFLDDCINQMLDGIEIKLHKSKYGNNLKILVKPEDSPDGQLVLKSNFITELKSNLEKIGHLNPSALIPLSSFSMTARDDGAILVKFPNVRSRNAVSKLNCSHLIIPAMQAATGISSIRVKRKCEGNHLLIEFYNNNYKIHVDGDLKNKFIEEMEALEKAPKSPRPARGHLNHEIEHPMPTKIEQLPSIDFKVLDSLIDLHAYEELLSTCSNSDRQVNEFDPDMPLNEQDIYDLNNQILAELLAHEPSTDQADVFSPPATFDEMFDNACAQFDNEFLPEMDPLSGYYPNFASSNPDYSGWKPNEDKPKPEATVSLRDSADLILEF